MAKSGTFLNLEVGDWGEPAQDAASGQPVIATPFQMPGWLASYRRAIMPDAPILRLSIVDQEGNALHLPLIERRLGPFRLLDVPGGKHASYHAAVIIGDISHWPVDAIRTRMREGVKALGGDALALTNSPRAWGGVANPLALPEAKDAPDHGFGLRLEADGAALLARLTSKEDRKKLRQKEKRLTEIGTISAGWIEGETREAALEQFFVWKSGRFAEKNIADPFAEQAARDFLRDAALGDSPALRLFGLYVSGQLVALLAGTPSETHFSGMLNANDASPEILRCSPGILVLKALIEQLCADGVQGFDLGVGYADYKTRYCPEPIALFDLAVPATVSGHLAARAFLMMRRAKRFVKQNPNLLAKLRKLIPRG